MEIEGKKPTSGYGKPPWIFKGSALYQLHLVKSETARAFIPKDFRLVEAFGYTLGGFFLASYDDSPVGRLDELVVIAGIVWNRPTSCAWAARVLVNSDEACSHGRKEFGLPSQVARFSKRTNDMPSAPKKKINGFLNMFGIGTDSCNTKTGMDVQVNEITSHASIGLFTIGTSSTFGETGVPKLNSVQSMGPVMKMSLPSFSGRTEHNPDLLKYSCQIECRVKPTSPAKVARLESEGEHSHQNAGEDQRSLSISVMLSKPILALQFSCLKMQVHPPVIVSEASHNPLPH